MLEGNSGAGVRHNQTENLWAVHRSTPQFWAWHDWMQQELGYRLASIGNWLTVPDEWPPTNMASAARVAKQISDMRDELLISRPVKRHPTPWNGEQPIVPAQARTIPINR